VPKLSSTTSHALSGPTEVTSFGDTNKVYIQGLPDVAGTFAGFWNDTDATLQTAASSADGAKLYLYTSTDAASRYAYGPAWIDVSYTTSVGDAVKISGSFAANGPWDAQI
jgi:hypothetical protein